MVAGACGTGDPGVAPRDGPDVPRAVEGGRTSAELPGTGVRELPGAAGAMAIGSDSLRVVFWPGDQPLAERAWRAASTPFHLPGLPEGASRIHGTIFLAPTPAAYDSLTRGAPGWSAGVAIPSLRRIVVPAFQSQRTPPGDPISALRHEIAHLALHAYLPGQIPRWFNEGYATWASGEWDEGAGWQIRLALLRRDAPLLDSLTLSWPRMAGQARLAYLLSASAVHHLATRASGDRAFTAFLQEWRRQGSFEDALRTVYLITPSRFEAEWRAMVRSRYGWLLALSQAGVFWLILTILFLVLGTARRRYDRGRLEDLRQQDRMLPEPHPDTYSGEVDLLIVPRDLDAGGDPGDDDGDPAEARGDGSEGVDSKRSEP